MISLRSVRELVAHFARRNRLVLVPMLAVLVIAGALLVATSGVAYVTPFVYALF